MTKGKADLDGILFQEHICKDAPVFMAYDWNPAGGFFVTEQRRLHTAGGLVWPAVFVRGLTPGEYDRLLYRALKAASATHVLALPKVQTTNVQAHVLRLADPGVIGQFVCGPGEEKPIREVASDFNARVWVSPLIPKRVVFALGAPAAIGLSVGSKDLKCRTLAIRNPELVFAFKTVGKWPTKRG